jgi:hypothetical protein
MRQNKKRPVEGAGSADGDRASGQMVGACKSSPHPMGGDSIFLALFVRFDCIFSAVQPTEKRK